MGGERRVNSECCWKVSRETESTDGRRDERWDGRGKRREGRRGQSVREGDKEGERDKWRGSYL